MCGDHRDQLENDDGDADAPSGYGMRRDQIRSFHKLDTYFTSRNEDSFTEGITLLRIRS